MEKIKEFWNNRTSEEKRKYIVYSVFGVVSILLFFIVFMLTNGNKNESISEMDNPDAKEAQKYNSRTEANQFGKKDSTSLNIALDDIFGNSGNTQSDAEPYSQDVQPMYTEPNYNSAGGGGGYSSSGGYSSGGGGSYNSHSVYGDYSMWQAEEPRNNSIGYTEVRNYPRKENNTSAYSQQPKQTTQNVSNSYVEPTYQVPVYDNNTQKKVGSNVRAKLISQGTATSGRSLSFTLLENTTINNIPVKKGTVITGISEIQNNRLMVNFSSVKINGKFVQANLGLMGNDGQQGLPISAPVHRSSNIGNRVKNGARGALNSIPVVGSVINDVVSDNNTQQSDAIKLVPNTTCYIVVY